MNRREMLTACAAIPIAGGAKPNVSIVDKGAEKPLVILSPPDGVWLSEQQWKQLVLSCEEASERYGVNIVPAWLRPTCPGKYSFSETLGEWSWSVTCQTKEELDEYIMRGPK